MTDLVLYHAVPSRAMVVHWMLEETGASCDVELLSLEAGEHKRPECLAINPLGSVPARRMTGSAGVVLTVHVAS